MSALSGVTAIWTEQAMRDYLREQPALVQVCGNNRMFIDLSAADAKLPAASKPQGDDFNHVVVMRSGGGQDGVMPMDRALITFHAFGDTQRQAHLVKAQLLLSLQSAQNQTLNPETFCYGATVESVTWLPTLSGAARFVVISQVFARQVRSA